MTRKIAKFTHAEISRATKVAKAQGMAVKLVPDGSILILPTPPVPVHTMDPDIETERGIVF
jgi:hypothetical protein